MLNYWILLQRSCIMLQKGCILWQRGCIMVQRGHMHDISRVWMDFMDLEAWRLGGWEAQAIVLGPPAASLQPACCRPAVGLKTPSACP